MANIVVVDDDLEMKSLVEDHLRSLGHLVTGFSHPETALKSLLSNELQVDVVITDLQMPDLSGLELMKRLKGHNSEIPVLVMTAFGSIESAVDAMRKGAFDYITKPFKLAELTLTLERAILVSRLTQDNQILRKELKKDYNRGSLLGKSQAMLEIFDLLERIAPAQSSVLITGESGTGKEVIARSIHQLSPRSQMPFIAVNCTAIPENLLESELFGHAKGSFTGADRNKKGLFQEAEGGTLFLDEIGDMDPSLQAKILRVLQERKIRPVGENRDIEINVRVLAATHKDLKKAIREGLFREDLFYRLNVIPVHVPPLRNRKEDIPLLIQSFLTKYSALNHSNVRSISAAALHLLIERPWPGNVRELENLIERLVVLCRNSQIDETDIPSLETSGIEDFYGTMIQDLPTFENLEKRYMQYVLAKTGGKKDKTAQILGINRRTLYRKEREYGFVSENELDPDHDPEQNHE